jgi:hypothetical protein
MSSVYLGHYIQILGTGVSLSVLSEGVLGLYPLREVIGRVGFRCGRLEGASNSEL